MGLRRDGALATAVLFVAVALVVSLETPLSPPALLAGGAGTLAFELLASRDPEAVRRHWERPGVQTGAVAVALGTIAVGAFVAPSSVLSVFVGMLGTYLAFLSVAVSVRRWRS